MDATASPLPSLGVKVRLPSRIVFPLKVTSPDRNLPADGALPPQPDIALLGEVLAGKTEGRRSDADITLFESLGVAIEDLACAAAVYQRAVVKGAGVTVSL